MDVDLVVVLAEVEHKAWEQVVLQEWAWAWVWVWVTKDHLLNKTQLKCREVVLHQMLSEEANSNNITKIIKIIKIIDNE